MTNKHPNEEIIISLAEYKSLKADSEFLGRLRDAGVDNWEWYSEACINEDDDDDPHAPEKEDS